MLAVVRILTRESLKFYLFIIVIDVYHLSYLKKCMLSDEQSSIITM